MTGRDVESRANNEAWLQVTAGSGPVECAWAVLQIVEKLKAESRAAGIEARVLEVEPGPKPGTAQSVLVGLARSSSLKAFVESWRGTVQWIARSPFRPEHKRKNWFVGVEAFEPPAEETLDPRDLKFETMRASGPGGQHVNRTESAVRVTHTPTGTQASAAEERSQHRNRKLALARLGSRLEEVQAEKRGEARKKRWQAHHDLERGNAARVYRQD
jgi:peptide chain release factor